MFTPEEVMQARLARAESRLDSLESDVQTINKRMLGAVWVSLILLAMLLTGFWI